MKKLLLMVALLLFPINVFAAESDFSGLYLGVDIGTGIDMSDVSTDYSYTNLFASAADAANNSSQSSDADNEMDFLAAFNADYNYSLGDEFYLGFGASVFLEGDKNVTSETYTFANPNSRADYPAGYSIETTVDPLTHVSVGIKPGLALSEKILAYLSVAYHYLKASVTNTTTVDLSRMNVATSVVDTADEKTFNGIGLGGGVKYKLSDNWLLNVFGEWVWFNEKKMDGPSMRSVPDEIWFSQTEEIQPSWVDLRVGLSYKF